LNCAIFRVTGLESIEVKQVNWSKKPTS